MRTVTPKVRRRTAAPPKPKSRAAKKVPAPKTGIRAQPLIAVRDIKASTRWYAKLLGVEELGVREHAHIYQRLLRDGSLVLQLHAWDKEDHPNLVNADAAPVGHGLLLWFEVDDFDGAVKRARRLKATVVTEPHVNPAPQHREMWLRDPDGYVVVIASPDGEAADGA
jgi:catechol 2,3-dioxygenase-like lactoylglutathione lyase family enzyme